MYKNNFFNTTRLLKGFFSPYRILPIILLGFEVNPGGSIISVKDKDVASSSVRTAADGVTYKVKDEAVANFSLYADFLKYDPWVVSTGLWFANKKMYIRNTDGGCSGASHYDPWYLQFRCPKRCAC